MANLNLKNLIKESITDYLNELNTEKEEIQETPILEEGASEFEDKVTKDGNIYLIKTPTKDMSEGGIVEEVSLKSLIGEGYVGAYLAGPQALAAGKKALKARDAKLKENVEIGKSKVAELEAKIEGLKKTIEDNSTRAVHDPQRRGELTETNDTLFAQLEKIENAVEKLKAVLEKESPKKAKKEKTEDLNEGSTSKYIVKYSKSNDTHQVWKGDKLITDFATPEKAKAEAKRLQGLEDIKQLDKKQK
jgi:myosin heavy subunit